MKNYEKKLLAAFFSAFVTGLLVMCGLTSSAFALPADGAPSGTMTKLKPRVNNAVSAGVPLTKDAKGVKVFNFTDTTATLVLDELGVTPVAGQVRFVEISSGPAGGACYLNYFDSSVASDNTEASGVTRFIGAPIMAVTSQMSRFEFNPPKQFHRGLVGLLAGTCRMASIGWERLGGAD